MDVVECEGVAVIHRQVFQVSGVAAEASACLLAENAPLFVFSSAETKAFFGCRMNVSLKAAADGRLVGRPLTPSLKETTRRTCVDLLQV